jgi:hypothetical protein
MYAALAAQFCRKISIRHPIISQAMLLLVRALIEHLSIPFYRKKHGGLLGINAVVVFSEAFTTV